MSKENNPQIQIADQIMGAEYTNAMQVMHNKEEFQMAFLNIIAQSGRVVSKVVTTPGHMKRILTALRENMEKYEQQFGTIDESQAPAQFGFEERK
ncbi:MAG: DUF3467 domain-containing protein [Candidatus Komeilibacteria bacterium CG_4_10_14_0_2_um_filter_37_10]|uniref:DUF3467 domain-containing protein n=1 Tax=Candidatus Komeilibacteria bacterium CG_4_10_14_0_2_um_filter_37_10 TaxID=1974470 RepID=A0A2M7VGT6_9BACT|nr:MAG: DUF3467 domain-containing protein [Candidatus Komeilibacteria bacterium CG_4_10_14_0_2_um_filter_37_10]PJA92658.1 MAG: DUF3467 domain-containing protein [Candidatus Komeilibacteria bacterium CG_4_9_14_3_um_filter_37_5]